MQKLKEIVCEILEIDADEITETSRFREDHYADSLRSIEILASLEKEFGIEIPQGELANMVNLASLGRIVEQARSA